MVKIIPGTADMAQAAANHAAQVLKTRLSEKAQVRIVVATGASQIKFLSALTSASGVDWSRVELFHLDEYVGLGADHPASFVRYIKERIIEPTGIQRYHLLDGLGDPAKVIAATSDAILAAPIDLTFAGIGENGHLAFNDPPADFDIEDPYLVVNLDDACRRQQAGEGWFAKFEDVPKQAISMSVRQIMKSRTIISVVPDERKADAVKECLEGPVSPDWPASILRVHPDTTLYLDAGSASKLALRVA